MIQLEKFEKSDTGQLISWIDSPAFLLQWAGSAFDFPLTEEQLESYVENADREEADVFIYKVRDVEKDKVIGHISLGRIDRKHRCARIGKVLVGDHDVRGKGIGGKMIAEVLKVAFNELNMHRVSLGVFDFNTGAIACYEKAGFVKEGLLRECRINGDKYWSMWEMSILKHEWLEKSRLNGSDDGNIID